MITCLSSRTWPHVFKLGLLEGNAGVRGRDGQQHCKRGGSSDSQGLLACTKRRGGEIANLESGV